MKTESETGETRHRAFPSHFFKDKFPEDVAGLIMHFFCLFLFELFVFVGHFNVAMLGTEHTISKAFQAGMRKKSKLQS